MSDPNEPGIASANTSETQVTQSILHRSAGVAVVIVAVKALSMAKEMVVAYYFGTSGALDAYLIAFLIPALAVNVFGASFQSALVPPLVDANRREGLEESGAFLSAILARYVLVLMGLTGILAVAAPLFLRGLGYGEDAAATDQAINLAYLLLPVFFFGSLSAFFIGVLAAQKKFLFATAVPALTTVSTIAFLVLFAPTWGVESMAVGVVIGAVAEAVLLYAVLRFRGFFAQLSWSRGSARIGSVFRQTRHIAVGAALMSGTTLVDQSVATWLGEGALSTFSYATRLTAVLLTVAAALSTVSLPYFSEMVSGGDTSGLRDTARRLFWAVAAGACVTVAGVALLSDPIVSLMFERGNFSVEDTGRVAWVQTIFVLQLPLYILVHLGTRLFFAAERGDVVIWLSTLIFLTNLAGDLLLFSIWGVAGIAAATVVSYLGGTVFVLYWARRLTG